MTSRKAPTGLTPADELIYETLNYIGIADQLLRAATSIGANIIEAQAASSKRDFINFLNHALKSGNETKFWLVLSKDLDNVLIPEIEKLLKERDELVKILGSSISTIKGKNKL